MSRQHLIWIGWVLVCAWMCLPVDAQLSAKQQRGIDKLVAECQAGKQKSCAKLGKMAKTNKSAAVRKAATEKVTDPVMLAGIALGDLDDGVRQEAVGSLQDQAMLADVARKSAHGPLRLQAAQKLTDPVLSAELVKSSSDSQVRSVVVSRVTDQALLVDLAKNDQSSKLRENAAQALTDPASLLDVARQGGDLIVRMKAAERLNDPALLTELVRTAKDSAVRVIAVGNLAEPTVLQDIAKNGPDTQTRLTAAKKISDPGVLLDLVRTSGDSEVRVFAVGALTDPVVLTDIARNDLHKDSRIAAIGKLSDPVVLAEIADHAADPEVRQAVVWRDPASGADFVWISAGRFRMGSPAGESGRNGDEGPLHRVAISGGFWLSRTEVTQAQWQAVMENNPSHFQNAGRDAPAENVSWDDCQAFIQKLNDKLGRHAYRLPTEAEWECACRAGTETAFHFGADMGSGLANFNGTTPYGKAARGTNRQKTMPAGSFKPNAFGLYDMHGNVEEWCQDRFVDTYYRTAGDGPTDPKGPDEGEKRVRRGGSWKSTGKDCRSANRDGGLPNEKSNTVGLRLVREP
ncbi:MAG: formylglycine-generating enzyme family protein [Acidobacteria bacterium]|nr:formylglycine-generating enzyme family protein [Acidobacteriota bacterium]